MADAEKPRLVQVMPARMELAEQWRQDWVVNAEAGTTTDDVLKPDYWSHVAPRMRPYDHVEVRAEDGTWVMNLLVTGCDRNWARVVQVGDVIKLTTADVAQSQAVSGKYKVEWKGPHHKHAVIRLSDQQMISNGHENRAQATAWMLDYERTA